MSVPCRLTLQAFEQFGALYMHSLDNKHPTRPGYEPSTSEFLATTWPNPMQAKARATLLRLVGPGGVV